MKKKNKNNKDLYIFLVSVVLVFIVSVAMLSLLRITSLYFINKETKNEIIIKSGVQIQGKTSEESLDPLIIPANK